MRCLPGPVVRALPFLVVGLLAACEDPPPQPVVSSVTPDRGMVSGGTVLTIGGANFQGASEVKVGDTGATIVSVSEDGAQIQATAPAHARGTVNVDVTTPGGTASLPGSFRYLEPVTATTLDPATITSGRTTTVVIRGTGLVAPVTVVVGTGTNQVTLTAGAGTELAVPVDVPTLPAGVHDVMVTNADDQSIATPLRLTVVAPDPPVVTSITPDRGREAGGTQVRIQGSNFLDATEVRFGTTAVTALEINTNGTDIVCTTPAGARGRADVQVVTPAGTGTLTSGFRYVRPVIVTGLSPEQVVAGTISTVAVSGTGLVTPVTVRLRAGGDPIDAVVTPLSENAVNIEVPVLPANDFDVTVLNGDQESTTSPVRLRVREGITLTAIYPAAGFTNETTTIDITGPDLSGITEVNVGAATCGNLTLVTSKRIRCDVPAASAGAVNVTVRRAAIAEGLIPNGFTYVSPNDSSVRLVNVLPAQGPSVGGVEVQVGATGVSGGSPSVTIGGVQANVLSTDGNRIRVNLPPKTLGAGVLSERVSVSVTSPAGSDTETGAFLYYVKPTLTAITPPSGAHVGGDDILVTGAGFTEEGTRVLFDGAPCTELVRQDSGTVRCKIPPHATGTATVVVENEFAQGDALAAGFQFVEAVRITRLSPDKFSTAGGTLVEATGSGFQPEAGRMELRIVDTNELIGNLRILSPTTMRFNMPPKDNPGPVTLRLRDTQQAGSFASGDFRADYVDRTEPKGGVGYGAISRNVSVTVLRQDNGARIAGAVVFIGEAYSTSAYRGTTNANGMVVLSGDDLAGPITLTAAANSFETQTRMQMNASEVTFALTPHAPVGTGVPALAEISGTIINWQNAGLPQGGTQPRIKRFAVIWPSEPRMGFLPRAPGPLNIISETPCDITNDGVNNPLGNQFTVSADAGRKLALVAIIYFYDSKDGTCSPGGEENEVVLAAPAAGMGIRSNIIPEAGTNPGFDISIELPVDTAANVGLAGAPAIGSGNQTARTADAILDLGASGIITFVNPITTQGTVGFGGVAPLLGYRMLQQPYTSLAAFPTGVPVPPSNGSYTVRGVSAMPVVNGGQIVSYTTPMTEAYLRDVLDVNVTVSEWFGFPSLTQPIGALSQRTFQWTGLNRGDGVIIVNIAANGGVTPVWSVLVPGGETQFQLPNLSGAPSGTGLTSGVAHVWQAEAMVMYDGDGFQYDEHTNDLFEQPHWRSHAISAPATFFP